VRARLRTVQEDDPDNVAKAVMDAGNGVLWNYDGQVARLVVERWWAAAQERTPFVQRDGGQVDAR
jgi:Holliday junction resolvase RusA-like endonuclease